MKNGQCPKCSSTEVYTRQYGLDGVRVDGRQVNHDDYICAGCGYYESYITDPAALQKVKATWKKVQ